MMALNVVGALSLPKPIDWLRKAALKQDVRKSSKVSANNNGADRAVFVNLALDAWLITAASH
jgi:hypothetical protein